jgi:uncharacterized membrane protein YhaH (DUF805 family)
MQHGALSIWHLFIALIWVALMVPTVWAYVRIAQKAGYSGWNVVWLFIPIANIVAFFMFAFGRWPIEEKLAKLDAKVF